MSEILKTAKYASIYAIGVFLNRAISFIMIPIYTRFLTASGYGIIELLSMTVDVFGMIAGLGLTAAVFRYYYKYESQRDKNLVISTITILLIILYLMASSIGFISSDFLAKIILNSIPQSAYYFKLIFIIFFIQAFIEIPLIFIRAQQKPTVFIFISTIKLLLQLSLNIYFVVLLEMNILGVLYSSLISSIIIGIILIGYTFHEVGFHFSKRLAGAVILFGAPLIISNLGDFVLTFSDRYFLKAYGTLSDVGVYSLGYKLGFLLWMFPVEPIFNIWGPQRFEIASKIDAQHINSRVFMYLNVVLIGCALLISLLSHDFFKIMSAPEFWDAYKIVPLIILAYVIQAWTRFCNFGVQYYEKTKYIALGTLFATISIILLSFLLIPEFKGYGAAIATIIAFFIRFIYINHSSQIYYPMKLPWIKILSMLTMAILIYLLSLIIKHNNILYSITQNMLLFFMYISLVALSPILSHDEKQTILNVLAKTFYSLRQIFCDH